MKLKFKRCYVWLALAICTALALLIAPVYMLCSIISGYGPGLSVRRGIVFYGRLFIILVRPVMPYSITLPQSRVLCNPCIIVANHQSFLDIYYIAAQKENNLCLVLKDWPSRRLFFFAPFMQIAGYINTKRNQGENFLNICTQTLKSGASILCFPEGTRTKTGKLNPFFNGIFRVAIQNNVPVVPMLFINTGKVCPPGSININPQPIKIKLLDPIYPDAVRFNNKPHLALKKQTFEQMHKTLTAG